MAIQIQKDNGETKVYEQVHERLSKFRKDCPASQGWAIITEVLEQDNTRVAVVAKIISPDGKVVATGHAEEYRNANEVNRSSAMENGETSAVGRALFMAGYGNGEICSAEELAAALRTQSQLRGQKVNPASSNSGQPSGNQQQSTPKAKPKPKPQPKSAPPRQQLPPAGTGKKVDPKVISLLSNMGIDTKALVAFDLNFDFDGEVVKIFGNQTKDAKHLWANKKFRWNGKEWWRKAA